MKTEKELFEEAFINAHGGVRFWLNTWNEEDYDYGHLTVSWAWQMWQASVNRDGYKLVPVEPEDKTIAHMINTPIEVNLLCDNADIFLSEDEARIAYKAMIGVAE